MTGLKNIIRSMKGNRSLYSSLLLQTVIVILCIRTIPAELTQQNSSAGYLATSGSKPNRNQVTTYDDCKKYLCKYGYLSCDCSESSSRRKRQLPDGLLPTEYNEETDSAGSTGPPPPPPTTSTRNSARSQCTDTDYVTALETFQANYRLNITGRCDARTTQQMSQRRCGQPDTGIDKPEANATAEERTKRKARSLTDIISSNIEMEETIERRKQQLKQYMKDIEQEDEALPQTDSTTEDREKRSLIYTSSNEYGTLIHKEKVSWRLMSDHRYPIIPFSAQRAILRQAFRYWSEVAPLCFYEVTSSQVAVDIEIGFLEGVHLSCYRQFDGYGGEIAHKFNRDVHFDNSEPYTIELSSDDRISLLLVAVHEIGHVIGLNHSNDNKSVMNAMYHQSIQGSFELSDHDRNEVKRSYGSCYGRFDTAFDYVRTKPGTQNSRIYTSFFFRNDHFWKYDNAKQRAKFGYPIEIVQTWHGVPENVDSFLHYWEFHANTATFFDEHMFFKDSYYYVYNPTLKSVIETGLIANKFPAFNHTTGRIPNNLDAVFYDQRTAVQLIYFFKNNLVYTYQYSSTGSHSCCVTITKIIDLFPPSNPSDISGSRTYATNIDSVYLSNSKQALYFIKGNDVWQNELFYTHPTQNSMKYVGKWNNLWQFICDGECS